MKLSLKKQWLNKHKKASRKLYNYAQRVPVELDTASVNGSMSPAAHKALEEIRSALAMMEGPRVKTMGFDRISGRSVGGADDVAVKLWQRFRRWHDTCEVKARDAVILFAQGERPTAIERMIRVRVGHGRCRQLIKLGIENYIAAGR